MPVCCLEMVDVCTSDRLPDTVGREVGLHKVASKQVFDNTHTSYQEVCCTFQVTRTTDTSKVSTENAWALTVYASETRKS